MEANLKEQKEYLKICYWQGKLDIILMVNIQIF
jgi:hypothetical protein